MKSVLVLDANQRSALAVTRSLGKRNIHTYTAEEQSIALAGKSRYSEKYFSYPSPRLDPAGFVNTVANLASQHKIDILLPMTELTSMLLLENKSAFPGSILPFADSSTVDSISDKSSLMRLAESLDVPTPKTWYVENPASPGLDLAEIPYPVVIKPGKSWLQIEGQWHRAAVRFASNPTELQTILDLDIAFRNHPFMIQEHVSGQGQGVFTLYDNGEPLVFFAHRRLREKPPSGGVSVLSESIPVAPELALYSRNLLDSAGWHGVAMVEFKVTPDDKPYLMEINTRFWGSLQLAVDSGVDFPYLLYQLSCGVHPDPVKAYQTGKRLRWLLGDVDNLYLTLRDKRYSFTHKVRSVADFATPSVFRTRHEVNRIGDMGPFWHELRNYIPAPWH